MSTAVRIRPLIKSSSYGTEAIVSVTRNNQVSLCDPTYSDLDSHDKQNISRIFNYDMCFNSNASNDDVYDRCAAPLVQHCVEGYNCSLIAYGQTGTGKTFTMMGDFADNLGLIQRICVSLYDHVVKAQSSNCKNRLQVSFIEIYNERVFDLMSETPHIQKRIRESTNQGAFVESLQILDITSINDIHTYLETGVQRRAVASTKINSSSSRSHAIFNVHLTQHSDLGTIKTR